MQSELQIESKVTVQYTLSTTWLSIREKCVTVALPVLPILTLHVESTFAFPYFCIEINVLLS